MTTLAHLLNIGIPRGKFLKKLIREISLCRGKTAKNIFKIFEDVQIICFGRFNNTVCIGDGITASNRIAKEPGLAANHKGTNCILSPCV